jgi:hypothetical protein
MSFDLEWENEEDREVKHEEQYYIDLHEKNKKDLETIDIKRSIQVRIIDQYEDNLLIEYHTNPNRFEEHTFTYVRVKDTSTGKLVFLSVPNNIRNCKVAIAWTFGLTCEEYDLFFQT